MFAVPSSAEVRVAARPRQPAICLGWWRPDARGAHGLPHQQEAQASQRTSRAERSRNVPWRGLPPGWRVR